MKASKVSSVKSSSVFRYSRAIAKTRGASTPEASAVCGYLWRRRAKSRVCFSAATKSRALSSTQFAFACHEVIAAVRMKDSRRRWRFGMPAFCAN